MKKWVKRISMFQLLIYFSVLLVNAQETSLSGKVSSKDGNPLPGVTVVVKGTSTGTITDSDGHFVLKSIVGSKTLVFSFIGMKSKEVPITTSTGYNIILDEDTYNLEEVVAIGYGTMKKSDLTGSVSSVKNEEIKAFSAANVLQALSGRSAGLQVKQNNGSPGGAVSVRIRGTNSIQGSNEPLYVIDGFPSSSSNPTVLNNSDIESIEILKDASAVAIYGSRGANGVVMITTNKGKLVKRE